MKEIEEFVKRLFKDQPEQKETKIIIIDGLKEKVEDLKELGLTEAEAINKAISEFGDIEDYYLPNIDKEKRRHKRKKTMQHYKNDLLFSLVSTALIIGILASLNFFWFYDEHIGPWFIVPSLGVLFWPLSILYTLLNKKGEK